MANIKDIGVKVRVDAKDVDRLMKRLEASMKKTEKAALKTSAAMDKMGKKGKVAGDKVADGAKKGKNSLGKMAVQLLRTRAGFVVLGLIAKQAFDIIIGNALRAHRESKKLGGTVDRLAAEIRTITGERGSRLPLIGQLMELSNQFGQTFESMAKAKYDIVSGGFLDAADSAHILEISAKAAVAGVSDVGTTAKVLVQSLRAYGKSAEEAEEFADTLFKTIKLGITTMPELAGSIGRVTPIAKIAGLSFDELGAAMSILTAKGLKTTEAATSLRALLKALISPSSDTGKALADLGVTMDAGFTQAMIRLGEAGSEGEAVLAELFNNIRAQMGVFTLASDNASLFVKTMEEFGDKKGSMVSAFDEVASTIDQLNKKQEQYIANYKKMKGLGAGEGAERSLEIIKEGLGSLGREAFIYETVLANLKSGAEAYATVLKEQALVKVSEGMSLQILKSQETSKWYEILGPQASDVTVETLALADAQRELAERLAEANKEWVKLNRRESKPRLDKAVMARMSDRIAAFNTKWASSGKSVKEYNVAFKALMADMKKGALVSTEIAPPVDGLGDFKAILINDIDEFNAILASGITLPSPEVESILLQAFVLANNSKTIAAAKALGVDMEEAIWKDGMLAEGATGPSELSSQMVAMVNKSVAEFEENVKGVERGVTLTKIVGLAKDGDWDAVKAQLADMAQSVIDAKAAIKQENKEAANLVRLGEQADAVRDKFNLLAGSKWFVVEPDVDIEKLRIKMEKFALSAGMASSDINDLYNAMVQGGGLPAEILEYLKQLMDELGDKTKDTKKEMAGWEKATEKIGNAIGDNIGRGMADIAAGTQSMREAFSRMKEAIIADITRIIVKMMVLEALTHITGFTFAQGGELPMAKGGSLPKAAAGMMIPSTGQAGLDSVPFIGMPGEGVIKRNTMQRLERFLSSSESSSAMGIQPIGGGSPMMVNFNIARPQSASDSVGMARTVSRMTREYNRRVM